MLKFNLKIHVIEESLPQLYWSLRLLVKIKNFTQALLRKVRKVIGDYMIMFAVID